MRYEAYGWQVIELADGTDADAISSAIDIAKACTDKPTIINSHRDRRRLPFQNGVP